MSSHKWNGHHPCLQCGACCAFFRVSFYWREAESDDHDLAVPAGSFEETDSSFRVMKGTSQKRGNRCHSLDGNVGETVSCKIYSNRPSPCQAFEASFEKGVKNPRCDEARAAHGLPALNRKNWKINFEPGPSGL